MLLSASATTPGRLLITFPTLRQDAFGETPAHKAARSQQWRTVRGLQKLGVVDLGVANVDEDSASDLLADKSRFWSEEGSSESLRSLRVLAKMRRDGEVNHSDFRRLKSSAIDLDK